jgi:hypothetical protein
MNAHSLGRGDVVMVGMDSAGHAPLTVLDNRDMPAQPGNRWIEFEVEGGGRFGMPFPTNKPLDRVVGARSAAGGSLS